VQHAPTNAAYENRRERRLKHFDRKATVERFCVTSSRRKLICIVMAQVIDGFTHRSSTWTSGRVFGCDRQTVCSVIGCSGTPTRLALGRSRVSFTARSRWQRRNCTIAHERPCSLHLFSFSFLPSFIDTYRYPVPVGYCLCDIPVSIAKGERKSAKNIS
jgi:hypothetical protein